MGSAFQAEPLYGVSGHEVVTFLMWPNDENADLVIHLPHAECLYQEPHRMYECGRFQPAPTSAQEGEK